MKLLKSLSWYIHKKMKTLLFAYNFLEAHVFCKAWDSWSNVDYILGDTHIWFI